MLIYLIGDKFKLEYRLQIQSWCSSSVTNFKSDPDNCFAIHSSNRRFNSGLTWFFQSPVFPVMRTTINESPEGKKLKIAYNGTHLFVRICRYRASFQLFFQFQN